MNTTHAWVEIFINNLGWVAFDPSHKKCIDDKYIRISTGFDFEDASIIKGVKNNYNGDEFLETKVDIENFILSLNLIEVDFTPIISSSDIS